MDRAEIVHENFLKRVSAADFPHPTGGKSPQDAGLKPEQLVEIFRSQVLSRQLDRTSRKLQARGEGFYTIGSSGHEGNAAVAAALRPGDMAFLHYRDAAFQIQRSTQVPGQTPAWDILVSFVASSDDPISGGRHKMLGSKALSIPPQTSTIASHLPKAVGAAYSIGLAKRLRPEHRQLADDAIIHCSFGDASANHSTSQGAFNTACWTAYQGIPLPLLFVCEDNGIGISTKTPGGWIEATMSQRPALRYFRSSGLDMVEAYDVARQAADYVRRRRKPAFLHMGTVRLYGHAGSDMQTAYMKKGEVEADEANDPLLHSARILTENGVLDREEVLAIYNETEERCTRIGEAVTKRPKLTTSKQVMASLVPPRRDWKPGNGPSTEQRMKTFGSDAKTLESPQHMARLLNWTLTDLMMEHDEIVLAGEDIGPKGGVYNVTSKLHARFGANRVINTLLDEQSILGLAIGLAHNGFVPIPEIQFLAYLHNAEDQLRGEAATLSFFSNGQFTNPMVIRIAGLGYQKGFGGHFHNDNSLAVLRDIPGIIVACPSNGADGVHMLRECVRLAREEQRVVVFVEPIALYMTRDLHGEKDGLWTSVYEPPGTGKPVRLGDIGQHGKGTDLAIVTYGNGYYLSRQAEKILSEEHGLNLRIIDLRWLAPLSEEAILDAVEACGNVLVVDECRVTGSQSEALMALLAERAGKDKNIARIAADDSFIPLGRAATVTLPSRDSIVEAALALAGKAK
ncbi:dehydrogenase E1 component subunit alpha/beta [Hoeflea sp. TYP-13]|uniref:dehydrogenase E1 component subunit alpha/beta n=1 Tax=Hoeflea sp. TYP-13 TaxID=3230023 RepID=UPI0034C5F49D